MFFHASDPWVENRWPSLTLVVVGCRLGTMWKHMAKEQKDKYFEIARMVDAEHKKKYPGAYTPYPTTPCSGDSQCKTNGPRLGLAVQRRHSRWRDA